MTTRNYDIHDDLYARISSDGAMLHEIEKSGLVDLPRSVLQCFDGDNVGAEIDCAQGILWITQEGDQDDHVLFAGDRFTIGRHGLVLVQAVEDAAFRLSPSKTALRLEQNRN